MFQEGVCNGKAEAASVLEKGVATAVEGRNANYFLNFSKLLGATRESKVDNSTSQEQILQMYKLGHEIPWDVRKPQPALEDAKADGLVKGMALEDAEAEGLVKGVVLDAGCGFGDNGIYLAKKGYTVVGFDFSEEAIEVAKKRAKEAGVEDRALFLVADALSLGESALR
ncbi:S-adenosyl-L-methionine-dependent methyltransferase [Baffinella frigidus]|nr:S-adenosyl-L-methionine-dependent methyltransferase [Cryptophyta sp. CCMP2293]